MAESCFKGIHVFSEFTIDAQSIRCMAGGKQLFSLATADVSNCSANKNELIVQMNDESTAGGDLLTEVRFYRPPIEDDTYFEQMAQNIRQHVVEDEQVDDVICVLPDLPFVVPRGKYTADIYPKELRLHGTSYNFTLKYPNITKAFCLEMPDGETIVIVLGFDKAMRQGETLYKFAVIQFKRNQNVEITLKSGEDYLSHHAIELPRQLSGPYWMVFAQVFRAVSRQNLTVQSDFQTSKGESALKCLVGTKQGHLFVLGKSLLFAIKPIVHIRFEDISQLILHRVDSNSKSFDLEVVCKAGPPSTFNSLDKDELEGIKKRFKDSGIAVTVSVEANVPNDDDYAEESESKRSESEADDNDDFIANEDKESNESEDEDFDPTKVRKKPK